MKKKLLMIGTAILLALVPFMSCNKANENVPNPTKPNIAHRSDLTPGELHNSILQQYDEEFGLTIMEGATNATEVCKINKRLIKICIEKGLFDSTIYSTPNGDTSISSLLVSGGFNSDGTPKTNDAIQQLCLSTISNPNIKTALSAINNYAGDPDNFIVFADGTLGSLSGLTDDEQIMISGFKSVLDASNIFWKPKIDALAKMTPSEYLVNIARCDAWGYIIGHQAAVDQGYWYLAAAFAAYKSASLSAQAAGHP